MKTKNKNAVVLCAVGERYIEYRKNLTGALEKYVQNVDIVDIEIKEVYSVFDGLSSEDCLRFARLAIPLLDNLHSYEKVVWIDVDTDISSERFAEIFSEETSKDGLAAVPVHAQKGHSDYIRTRFVDWNGEAYFSAGVLLYDMKKINEEEWERRSSEALFEHSRNPFEHSDQDVLNGMFEIRKLDDRFNWDFARGIDRSNVACLVHYSDERGHDKLDEIISLRDEFGSEKKSWKDRCIVISPRHAFIRPWIRAYFATGNTTPLVIVPGPPGDWRDDDMEYCKNAAAFCGGLVFDCSSEWRDSRRLAERAVKKTNVGWFTKKSILHAVATRLAPKTWAWIDDDAEVTGCLDECFEGAERASGFVFTQFYYPDSIDNCHPARMYRSNIDTGDKICWNSMVFFHGEANQRLSEELGKDFPVEDDEIVFGNLYQTNKIWHDGFCDYSIRNWQANCKKLDQIPKSWNGKLLHYTTMKNGGEVKKLWASKANTLPKAPFENEEKHPDDCHSESSESVDAVFVIGTGSVGNNEELRYALRNIEKNCPFVRNVYICGFCPSWVDKSVVKHLQWPDRFSHAKDANIIDKLRHACEQPGIAKRILFCSDDQFQTRVCTWDDFAPRYLRRYSSSDGWYEGKRRVWHSRLRRTLERDAQRRRSIGMDANDVFYYQPHIWMPVDRDLFIDYARWCGYERRDDTIIASGYFNFVNAEGKPDFDHVFIGGDERDIPTATHVAYHDGSYHVAMRMLKKMFPDACKYELSPEKKTEQKIIKPKEEKIEKKTSTVQIVRHESELNDDPSPARSEETAEILDLISRVRNTPTWHGLLGEISRAEELRLFGVIGWRTVWSDIIARWKESTCCGKDILPVASKRSESAARVIKSYLQNPDGCRTVRFGPQNVQTKQAFQMSGRQLPRPASISVRDALRERIRTTLR